MLLALGVTLRGTLPQRPRVPARRSLAAARAPRSVPSAPARPALRAEARPRHCRHDPVALSAPARSLSEVVKHATKPRVRQLNIELVELLAKADDELRDVYAIGIKTIINDSDGPTAQVVAEAVMEPLAAASSASSAEGLAMQALDLLASLLQRPEVEVAPELAKTLLSSFLAQLASPEPAVKKRATVALGALSPHLGDALLDTMVGSILSTVGKKSAAGNATTLVQVLGAVSRRVGWRLGRHLDAIVPVLARSVGDVDDESMHSDEACELRETCLHALESLVLRCPSEVTPHLAEAEAMAQRFMSFDPNYDYSGDDEDDEDDYGDDYGDDSGDEFGDDDDADDEASWKVRRAAARLLTAIVATRPERLRSYYEEGIAEAVLANFRERDENVKLDVIACFTALLRSTITSDGAAPDTMPGGLAEAERTIAAAASATGTALGAAASGTSGSLGAIPTARGGIVAATRELRDAAHAGLLQPPALSRQFSVAQDALPTMASDIVERAVAQVDACKKGKGQRVKSAVLQLLRQLCLVLGEGAQEFLADVVAVSVGALDEGVASLRLEGLETLRTALDTVPHEYWIDQLPTVVPAVAAAVGDEWYKCVAEALRVAGRLAVATRPSSSPGSHGRTAQGHVQDLLAAIRGPLGALDADQEVKEASILASGLLLAYAGDLVDAKRVGEVQAIILERMRNEVTRTCALKSLAFIANSPLGIDMSAVLGDVITEVASLLRQKSRSTRQASLNCLSAILSSRASSLSTDQLEAAFAEAASMVTDEDLFLAQRALEAATSLAKNASNATAAAVFKGSPVVAQAVALASSPVVHGPALVALTQFLPAAANVGAAAGVEALSADRLAEGIAAPLDAESASSSGAAAAAAASSGAGLTSGHISKQSVANAAACVAALVASGGSSAGQAVSYLETATAAGTAPARRLLALFTLGELGGLGTDILGVKADALDQLSRLFDSAGAAAATEDVKTAAAAALGGIITGSTAKGMAWLQAALGKAGPKSKYLLLAALKGVTARHAPLQRGGKCFHDFAADESLIAVVEKLAADDDASVRAMAGEVEGRLAAAAPDTILPRVVALAGDKASDRRRAAAAVAFRFAVASNAAVDGSTTEAVLATALDANIEVKLAGLQAIHTTVNSAPALVADMLRVQPPALTAEGKSPAPTGSLATAGIQAVVFADTQVRPDLQRVVDMGPFKQNVDGGLPLRKAAFSCLEAMFDHFKERLPADVFVARLCDGLRDADDVMLLAHQLLAKAAVDPVFGRHILASLPDVVGATRAAFAKAEGKTKKSAEGGGSDVIRSAMRVLVLIVDKCPEAKSVPAFASAMDEFARHPTLGPMLATARDYTAVGASGMAGAAAASSGWS